MLTPEQKAAALQQAAEAAARILAQIKAEAAALPPYAEGALYEALLDTIPELQTEYFLR